MSFRTTLSRLKLALDGFVSHNPDLEVIQITVFTLALSPKVMILAVVWNSAIE
jgi:hypothetical protein